MRGRGRGREGEGGGRREGVRGREREREREGGREREREGGRGREGWMEGPEVDLCGRHRRRSRLLRTAVACDARASRRAVLRNGLPGRIRICRPARAALIVKQRGAAMDALKAHKRKRAPVCTRERESI